MVTALKPTRERATATAPERSKLASTLIAALNLRSSGGLRLRAAAAGREQAGVWIAFNAAAAGRCHIAPLLADGAVPSLVDAAGRPDAAAAALALGPIEALVAAIELVIGQPLRPTQVVDTPPPGEIVVTVEGIVADRPLHRVLLAIGEDATINSAAELPLDELALAAIVPEWTATMAGPPLRQTSVARMAAGDLLMLGVGRCVVQFRPPGRGAVLVAALDVQGGSMVIEQVLEGGDGDASGADQEPPADSAQVSTVIEIAGGGVSMERLASLDVGGLIALPGTGGGVLPVTVRAGEEVAATGDLIAIGDGYGVLVSDVFPTPAQS